MSTNSGASFFVHGGPQDPLNQCIYPDSCLEDISADHSFLFMGHTHRPFIRRNGTRTFVNVGSCGLPRDNGVLGSFCLFDEINGLVDIIRYDISNIARKIDSRHDVHNDVKDIFKRKSTGYCGTLIEQYDRGVS